MSQFVIQASGITSGTAATKTLAQCALAATAAQGFLIEWSVSFQGTNAAATPILITLNRQTSAGSGGVSNTPTIWDNSTITAANAGITALTGPTGGTWTTEPTAGTVEYNDYFTPVGQGPSFQYPYGRGPMIPSNARLAVVIASAPAAAVNVAVRMVIEI